MKLVSGSPLPSPHPLKEESSAPLMEPRRVTLSQYLVFNGDGGIGVGKRS